MTADDSVGQVLYHSKDSNLQEFIGAPDQAEHPEGLGQQLKQAMCYKKQLLKSMSMVKRRTADKLVFGICICGDMRAFVNISE